MFLLANALRMHNSLFKIGFLTLPNCYSTVAVQRKSRSDLHLPWFTKVNRPVVNCVHTRIINEVHLTTYSAYRLKTLNRALSTKYHTPSGSEVAADGDASYRCSCCGLNSPGDLEIAEFLSHELEYEREIAKIHKELPIVDGFELSSADGPVVTLTRLLLDETVRVKFNVMDSVDHEDDILDSDGDITDDCEEYHLECFPSFIVEIEKKGVDNMLTLHCVHMPACEVLLPEDSLNKDFAAVEIQRVTVIEKTGGTQKNIVFLSTMDNLHERLLVILFERGINERFYQQMIDLSGVLDHRCYVSFLEKLKDFARSQPQARNCF